MRALRARVARKTAGMRPTAASEPLVGPPPPEDGFDVGVVDYSFRPANFVLFGAGEENDFMTLSTSKKVWASQWDRPDQEGPETSRRSSSGSSERPSRSWVSLATHLTSL